jgi:hypothetical protein
MLCHDRSSWEKSWPCLVLCHAGVETLDLNYIIKSSGWCMNDDMDAWQ